MSSESSRQQPPPSGKSEGFDPWSEMDLSQTIIYSKDVIKNVLESIMTVLGAKKYGLIKQKQIASQVIKEMQPNKDDIMKAFMFSVKPDFRKLYLDYLDKILELTAELNL